MPDREDELSLSRGTLYCELHERYYRSDTGCLLCNMIRGESYNPEPVKEIKIENTREKADKCHYCGEESLVWSPAINMYECSNPVCRRRVSRFTRMGLVELLDDSPRSRDIPAISEKDAREVTRNFAVNPKRYSQMVGENIGHGIDVVMPCDTELAGYSRKGNQVVKGQIAALKSILILMAFICLGFAVWTVLLLVAAEISQLAGIMLLAAVFGILIWSVYGIMAYKTVNLGVVLLFLFVMLVGFALCGFAGVEPFSSIESDVIQFFSGM